MTNSIDRTTEVWVYQDQERITDPTRGGITFIGLENGTIIATPNKPYTGAFLGVYDGSTADGCYDLHFTIAGQIDISGMGVEHSTPVNVDSGYWFGSLTSNC